MTSFKYVVFVLAMAAGLCASSIALAQTDVNWLPAGTDTWNTGTNWADTGFGQLVPEAQYDEVAQINSGGTAQVTDTPPSIGGIKIDNGTVDVTATGNLVSRPGDDGLATGNVTVSSAGTLNVAGGGALSVEADLELGGTYSVELTALAQKPVSVTGNANLGGAFIANFNGTVGSTWDVIDAASFSGSFASISTSGPTLPLGQVYGLQQVPGGTNGTLLRLGTEQRLVLNLDRETGIGSIENLGTSTVDLALDGYSIESTVGSLDPAGWESFQNQGLEDVDNLWAETGSGGTLNALAELNPWTSATLAPGTQRTLGAIYAPNFTDNPFGQETEDHVFTYHTQSGETQQGVVNYVGDKQYHNIVLTVDPTTGEATMQNESGSGVEFDSYTIASDAGGLLTTWDSLEDQGAVGAEWLEANPSANRVSEVTTQGVTLLNQNEGYNLATLFNSGSEQDLTFQFLLAGTTTVIDGVVVYGDLPMNIITPGLQVDGDYNGSGQVEQGDLDLVLLNWGSDVPPTPSGWINQVPSDGKIDQNDLDGVLLNWGNSATAATVAVPEPATGWLLLVALTAWCYTGRRPCPVI